MSISAAGAFIVPYKVFCDEVQHIETWIAEDIYNIGQFHDWHVRWENLRGFVEEYMNTFSEDEINHFMGVLKRFESKFNQYRVVRKIVRAAKYECEADGMHHPDCVGRGTLYGSKSENNGEFSPRVFNLHHRLPKRAGGTNEMTNLMWCTQACHANIHADEDTAVELGLLIRTLYDARWSEFPMSITDTYHTWRRSVPNHMGNQFTSHCGLRFTNVVGGKNFVQPTRIAPPEEQRCLDCMQIFLGLDDD